ncbi:Uncharacterised protein [Kingella potus]|uniref:PAP2 superfamily n=1 Tax=Kingella potus TaxID=265175 RepID=A0A377R2G3_9NEIS|nr:phosphatase PAP2 family protein [Kingella potus]UOP00499.1 phosphatase PAP2 family protein [Kingella potus]STR02424.1 Uncharacterised protein [Kingella potus]
MNPINPNRPSENEQSAFQRSKNRDSAFALALSALFVLLFALLYGGANLLAEHVPWRIRPALPFEAAVPFAPAWSVVYLSLPLLLVLCGLRADRRGAWVLFAVLAAELAAAVPFFVLLPVQTSWPPRVAEGFWQPFFAFADAVSLSRNHLPSLHAAFACTAAWFAFRQRLSARVWFGAWAAAVAASAVLIHEHHLIDLAAGFLLAFAACRLVSARAGREAVFRRAETEYLLWREQAAFARRHRRYALISLLLALYRLRRPQRGGLMAAGYCFLQAFDDLMDGDRPSENPPAEADRLINAWQSGRFAENDRYSRLAAHFRGRLNAVLPPAEAEKAFIGTASLLRVMRRDRFRAEAAELWPAEAVAAQHRATFSLSLDLLFAAAGASVRSRDVPELADALGWCSTMRDLPEDLAAGIINIPAEIWHEAGLPSAKPPSALFQTASAGQAANGGGVRTAANGLPRSAPVRPAFSALSAHPVLRRWIRGERTRALALLDALDARTADLPDPASRRIVRLFSRSVRGFAGKRMRRLFPWL